MAISKSAVILIVVSNVGGSANGAVIGGCSVSYAVKQDGKRWVVEFHGSFDPASNRGRLRLSSRPAWESRTNSPISVSKCR